ncbi:hypothetical protein LC613_22350 [Nostoc sphaeroides CHAB 2801]|uniref:hypothetical protein n=1 Tax=Nostoc sphaeroides TaxID=446679 RepID=UPI000E5251C8|nr:hypothetical protein [Nostoc sphaeroides]MCC5630592.1 hypothetical protein [Nostoc sphaeroides CHAB 2801]
MTKNNRKKAVAQAISTAVALGWVIMQVESAQAATLTVNNLNDSGVGSLRDTINIANNNDVVEFLLGSHPSAISLTSGALAIAKNLTINGPGANLLTISGNNHFPVFDINAADVTFSGLAIAGNINAYNSSNLTFINSTINGDNLNIDINGGDLTLINSTISGDNVNISAGGTISINSGFIVGLPAEPSAIAGGNINSGVAGTLTVRASEAITIIGSGVLPTRVLEPSAIAGGNINSGAGGSITVTTGSLFIRDGATVNSNSGSISDGLGGNISVNASNGFIVAPPNEPSAIAGGNITSGAGGNITLTTGTLLLTRVPEPSAIAGSILAASLAWLAKRNFGAFRKAKI